MSAWAAGEADKALRFANLAIHYDPLHQDAIDLRQEILANYPDLETSVHHHLRHGLPIWEHPLGDHSAETGAPWRDIGPEPVAVPAPLIDEGSPGPVRRVITDAPEGDER